MLTLESLSACTATLPAEDEPDDTDAATPIAETANDHGVEQQERRAYVNAFTAFFGEAGGT